MKYFFYFKDLFSFCIFAIYELTPLKTRNCVEIVLYTSVMNGINHHILIELQNSFCLTLYQKISTLTDPLKKAFLENIVGKGEHSGYPHFLIFQSHSFLSLANAFNLHQSKIVSFVKSQQLAKSPSRLVPGHTEI